MTRLIASAKAFMADESGATTVEYALMLAFISLICLAAVTAMGSSMSAKFNAAAAGL